MSERLERAIIVGDLQLPYGDWRAIKLTHKVMKSLKPEHVLFSGDVDDQLEYSRFSDGTTDDFMNRIKKTPNESPLPFIYDNAKVAKDYYTEVRAINPDARMFSALGNHDIRVYKYLDSKMPDLLEHVNPNSLYDFSNLGIDYMMYDERPKEIFEGTGIHIHHGTTVTTTGLAVKNDIMEYNISLIRGHDHRGGVVHKHYPLSGTSLVGLGTGHLCDPNAYGLKYAISPSWQLGFGMAWIDGTNVHLDFIEIKPDYTCVVGGRLYKG